MSGARKATRLAAKAAPGPAIDATEERVEAQRQRLFDAHAIVVCCRYALDSQLEGLDEIVVGNALQVASDIINDAVAELERS